MYNKQTAKQLMDALPSGKRHRGQPKTHWQNYVKDLAWSHFGLPAAKLPLVTRDHDTWRPNSSCCPATPKKQAGKGKYTE